MLITLEETKALINEGNILHIAADESLLKQLPKGKWIAGTTPYFITEKGGMVCKDKLFVDIIDQAIAFKTIVYTKDTIFNLSKDAYANGMVFLIIPFASETAVFFAKEAPNSEDLLMTPTVGWISGFDLSGNATAKVFDGMSGTSYEDKAVALHICLPDHKAASIGIINIFDIDRESDKIEFIEDTLSVSKCYVNKKEVVFLDYLSENGIDTKLPLVSDYNSVLVNVSIKEVSQENKTVDFYAPVFKDKEYHFANPISNYAVSFGERLKAIPEAVPVFSCNCILNYLYGELEGKATPPFAGPITFGEIAYLLLNQTLVYTEIIDK
jgi:hypothetical protein